MLKDLEAIKLISKNINSVKLLFLFLKSDCKINIGYETSYSSDIIGAIEWVIIYNDKKIEVDSYFNNLTVETAITTIFNILLDKDKDKVKEQVITFDNKTKDEIINKDKLLLTINNNNTNNNNLSNMANIKIETYSDLRSFVENNTNIENKTEIVNLIKELEKSKDDENKEDYIDKFLKLLELLENILPIPPAIIKGAKTAKKFFDAIKNKNND